MSKTSEQVADLEREVALLRDSCCDFATLNDSYARQIGKLNAEIVHLRIPASERMRAMQSKIDKQSDRIVALEAELVTLRELDREARRYADAVMAKRGGAR